MKLSMKHGMNMLAVAAALAVAPCAFAQSAGQLTAKLGFNKLTPKVESGDISAPALPGSKGDVGSDTEPVLVFTYGLTDNVSAEMALGVPYKHEIYGAGAIQGTGKLGSIEALPPTVFLQYRFFQPKATLRPYVGLGLTYAYFQKARGSGQMTALTNTGGSATTFKIDNKFAATLQAGLTFSFTERWFADVSLTKTFLKTRVNFSTGQYQDMTLNPLGLCAGIGYKF